MWQFLFSFSLFLSSAIWTIYTNTNYIRIRVIYYRRYFLIDSRSIRTHDERAFFIILFCLEVVHPGTQNSERSTARIANPYKIHSFVAHTHVGLTIIFVLLPTFLNAQCLSDIRDVEYLSFTIKQTMTNFKVVVN